MSELSNYVISTYGKGIKGQLYALVQEVKPRHWNSSWDSWHSLGHDVAVTGFEKFKTLDDVEKLQNCIGWMEANVPEMDCRGDEDCDHCFGMNLLAELKK